MKRNALDIATEFVNRYPEIFTNKEFWALTIAHLMVDYALASIKAPEAKL